METLKSPPENPPVEQLLRENAELRARLDEAEETLRAIRNGEVDAVIVSGTQGDRVFSLVETENLYRRMVETMNEAGMAVSIDGTIMFCNERACSLLGQTREQLIGQSIGALITDNDRELFNGLLQTAMLHATNEQVRFITGDGSLLPMHLWANHFNSSNGPMICLIGTDLSRVEAQKGMITRLHEQQAELQDSQTAALNLMDDALLAQEQVNQTTKELKKSREDLNHAQAVARVGSWRIDIWNNTMSWSDENYRIFGVPAGTPITYDLFLSLVHPEDRDEVDKSWNAAVSGEPFDIEHRIVVGVIVKWVRTSGGMEFDENGLLRSGFGTTQDITDRKRLETDLADKGRLLEKLVSRQTQEIINTRESLGVETVERRKVEDELTLRQKALEAVYEIAITGESSFAAMNDQVVLNIARLMQVPFAAVYIFAENRVIMSSLLYKGELRHDVACDIMPCITGMKESFRPDGTIKSSDDHDFSRCKTCFPHEEMRSYIGVPIQGGRGQMLGIICVLDTRERSFDGYEVRLIEIFARYLAHEQTQHELELQLMHSNEMKVLGQLTSGVAHEVRNPLNGIMAIMNALSLDLSEMDQFKPYIDNMQNLVTRLSGLMEDLLSLGRPIRDERKITVPAVSLAGKALAAWQQSTNSARQVDFVKPLNGGPISLVNVDGGKIEQAIINLLDNAHQHTVGDGPIGLYVETVGPGTVRIAVKDNGPGIPDSLKQRVFEPFYTTRKGGTGLGLSIVRHIVESHGGTIAVKNNEGSPGSTFSIELPLAVATLG
jgi:PAS domain S-box-containing protein